MRLLLMDGAEGELAHTLALGVKARLAGGERPSVELVAAMKALGRARSGQLRDSSGHPGVDGCTCGYDGPMDLSAAAQLLGCSDRTVRRRVRSGQLAARREGRRLLFDRSELDRYRAGGGS